MDATVKARGAYDKAASRVATLAKQLDEARADVAEKSKAHDEAVASCDRALQELESARAVAVAEARAKAAADPPSQGGALPARADGEGRRRRARSASPSARSRSRSKGRRPASEEETNIWDKIKGLASAAMQDGVDQAAAEAELGKQLAGAAGELLQVLGRTRKAPPGPLPRSTFG